MKRFRYSKRETICCQVAACHRPATVVYHFGPCCRDPLPTFTCHRHGPASLNKDWRPVDFCSIHTTLKNLVTWAKDRHLLPYPFDKNRRDDIRDLFARYHKDVYTATATGDTAPLPDIPDATTDPDINIPLNCAIQRACSDLYRASRELYAYTDEECRRKIPRTGPGSALCELQMTMDCMDGVSTEIRLARFSIEARVASIKQHEEAKALAAAGVVVVTAPDVAPDVHDEMSDATTAIDDAVETIAPLPVQDAEPEPVPFSLDDEPAPYENCPTCGNVGPPTRVIPTKGIAGLVHCPTCDSVAIDNTAILTHATGPYAYAYA